MSYPVIRTDLMTGTDVGAGLVSLRYCTGAKGAYVPAEIPNGSVVKLVELEENNREVWVATDVAANDKLSDVVIVASVETIYDERKHNLDEFTNEANAIARGFRFYSGNMFSLTADAFADTTDLKKGAIVELAAGHKLKAVKTATASSTTVGKVEAVEIAGRYTYYVIKVD